MENDCRSKGDEKQKRECAEDKAKDIFGTETKKGKLRFYDGQIILFPVSSIQGTVWITTKELLEYWFGKLKNGEKIKIPEERALFTYEAIPRGTVFGLEIRTEKRGDNTADINEIMGAISPYFKLLGIGGMGTRGFGRLELDVDGGSSQQTNQEGGTNG